MMINHELRDVVYHYNALLNCKAKIHAHDEFERPLQYCIIAGVIDCLLGAKSYYFLGLAVHEDIGGKICFNPYFDTDEHDELFYQLKFYAPEGTTLEQVHEALIRLSFEYDEYMNMYCF